MTMPKANFNDPKYQEAKRLINLNEDSRQYFYEKANETWLEWLWENGFFDVLKQKAEDPTKYSYSTPELRYLVRMAETKPEIVTEVMLGIPISEETFNPEVIDQFLRICGVLPGAQLAKITKKIKNEKWPALMQHYFQFGMDYGKLFDSLNKSGHYEELLVLASAVLEFREDWATKAKEKYSDATPFCLTDISYSKVFYYLSNIEEEYVIDAIDLLISILKELTIPFEQDQEVLTAFKEKDGFPLYDVDVFEIGLRSEYQSSGHQDVQEIVALLKFLTKRVLLQQCSEKAQMIFKQNFESLPDSWLMWRIRLYILSLCPLELMPGIQESLYRIFREESCHEIIKGAEYKKLLKIAFPLMEVDEQSKFVSSAKALFSSSSDEDGRALKVQDGSRIFSVIGEYLSDEQVDELGGVGFEINSEYVPRPIIEYGEVGWVNPQGPVSQEEFRNMSVSSIVDKLKGDWSPSKLVEQDTQRDFLNPLNADGMGNLLREDVKTRIQEYLKHTNGFLDLENIDMHYLYVLLDGLTDAIDTNLKPLSEADWSMLIDFCVLITQKGKEVPLEQLVSEVSESSAWLGRWNAVLSVMINLLSKILREKGKNLGFEWKTNRFDILSIIEYSFEYPDPKPEDEKIVSAKITISNNNQEQLVADPYTLAINSIRGKAFELLALAVESDSKKNYDSKQVELSADLKRLFESLLVREETRAIMFLFGRYVPFFFFRDKNWLKSLLNKIFPTDNEKKYLYLAAWEGYLSNNLYLEIFNSRFAHFHGGFAELMASEE